MALVTKCTYGTWNKFDCTLNALNADAKKTCRTNSITFRGPKYWKTLSDNIRSATSLRLFKTRLEEHLIANYADSNI